MYVYNIHMYIYIYTYINMYMYTYRHIYNMYKHTYTLYIYTHIYIYTYMYTHIYVYKYMHTHTHTQTHTHTHTHTYNARNRPAKKRMQHDSSYAPESHQISPNTAPEFDFLKKSPHSHKWVAAHIRRSHVPHQNGTCTRTHNHSAKYSACLFSGVMALMYIHINTSQLAHI